MLAFIPGFRKFSGELVRTQKCNLFFVRSSGIFEISVYGDPGGFQDLGNVCKIRVMDDAVEGRKADLPFAQIFVPVFGSAPWIFAVVDMEDGDLVFTAPLQTSTYKFDYTVSTLYFPL